MLRFIHTADWHLGQSFHGFDRDHEHGQFLDWLLATLRERRPDALIIAGDLFDTVNPSAIAQRRFYSFLAKAHAALPEMQVVLTAGNHDAAARLEAPAGVLESLRISVVGTVARKESGVIEYSKFLVPLRDSTGAVKAIALAVPFLRPADVPTLPEAADPYLEGIRELYAQATAAALLLRDEKYPGAILLGLGHCHMQDGAESRESERRLVIGGSEALKGDTFPPELAYVALGHLHKPQQLDGGRIRYSGSPMPLSFSEKDYAHQVLEVTLDANGLADISSIPIPKTASLIRLPASKAAPIEDLLALLSETPFDESRPPEAFPFLELRVLETGPDPTRRRRIEQALLGKPVRLASIKLESPGRPDALPGESPALPTLSDLATLDPLAILSDAHFEKYKTQPDETLLVALREILTNLEGGTL